MEPIDSMDNGINLIVEGGVPEITKTEPCCLGIDEAGRGPVLGPMVYGTCFSPVSQKDYLKELGFADSKTLNEQQREELFEKINKETEKIGWIVDILAPNYISNCMLRRSKYNLNELSHDTAIGLIRRALDGGANITEVYVDTVGKPETYQAKLKGLFPQLDITVAKKADSTYPIVSAASICAKVARDRVVKSWKFKEEFELDLDNYGSGYPADPKTKKFMSASMDTIFGFPQFVRFSWSTASTILDDKAVAVHWEDDDEEENSGKNKGPSVKGFFQVKETNTRKNVYFTERHLKQVMDF